MSTVAVASLIVAVAAIIIACASVVYTRRQAVASGRQAIAAEGVAAIEQKRRQDELTPDLAITCAAEDQDGDRVQLTIELTGPAGLDRLDEVTVRIRDDMPREPSPANVTALRDFNTVIWGPYRIKSGLMKTDSYGRAHGPVPLPKNEPHPIPLERTFMPPWMDNPQYWLNQYQGTPVRLEITCRREGHDPWTLLPEITPAQHPTATFL